MGTGVQQTEEMISVVVHNIAHLSLSFFFSLDPSLFSLVSLGLSHLSQDHVQLSLHGGELIAHFTLEVLKVLLKLRDALVGSELSATTPPEGGG